MLIDVVPLATVESVHSRATLGFFLATGHSGIYRVDQNSEHSTVDKLLLILDGLILFCLTIGLCTIVYVRL